jgi:hypothetical protein
MTKPSTNSGAAGEGAARTITEPELAAEQPELGVDVAHASTRAATTVEPQA